MMSTEFIEKIEKLSPDKKKEVEDFVDFLIAKANADNTPLKSTNLKAGFEPLELQPKLKKNLGA